MIRAKYTKHVLKFRVPATTSRGALREKVSYYLFLYDDSDPLTIGVGECSPIPGLSYDDRPELESKIKDVCSIISKGYFNFKVPVHNYPSIQFALETAYHDLKKKATKVLFPSKFTEGKDFIRINGLIWMGDKESIKSQIKEKLKTGFNCIKIKVGNHDFESELSIISAIRKQFSRNDLEIRVDANGAYSPKDVLKKLGRFADLDVHSIEQPILPAQLEDMARICQRSPIPIALDEELIGKHPIENKRKLLEIVKPHYIVLKPGLLGGFRACEEWIDVSKEFNTNWWVTSALESNLGLSAVAQWTYSLGNPLTQGLGTGMLYLNNLPSPLAIVSDKLYYFPATKWDLSLIQNQRK